MSHLGVDVAPQIPTESTPCNHSGCISSKEHFPVGTLATTYKEDEVVAGCKLRDAGHTVRYRAADGIKTFEFYSRHHMRGDIVDDTMVFVKRLCGL